MVWCRKHNMYHKGRIRKWACEATGDNPSIDLFFAELAKFYHKAGNQHGSRR